MSESKSLRDEFAMSAPIPQHATDGSFISEESTDEQIASEIRLRYRYADIAMRVRAETMPKPSVNHPEWARWAARLGTGICIAFENEPSISNNGWLEHSSGGRVAVISGDTSWIPANWRESKVKL